MAWMRMMGADSVAYHRDTVLARGDDHPGQALAYYASRGETPLRWGGRGAQGLGLQGAVTDAQYEALFGPGGACDPTTGERLVTTKCPGLELVISAHKSVAELGVIGRAEDMHRIMDAERDATLAYLDQVTAVVGGRRGRGAQRTATEGMIYATTRHATSRAGDPCPHDHVLVANLVRMADARGGWKAADTALWREYVHAATMVGRVASAQRAVELGYGIVPDAGPSGRLGQHPFRTGLLLSMVAAWHTAGGGGVVRVLVVLIAVLLPAGAFAVATVDAGQPRHVDMRVGAAGFGQELLADDQPSVASTVAVTSAVGSTPTVTVTLPAPPAPLPTVPGRTATTAPRVAATFPTPPGLPPLPMPTSPRNPSASTWSKTANGITVRMHIEPAMPVAGRPVTFVIDEVIAPVTCCVMHLVPDGTTIPLQGAGGENPEIGICGSPPAMRSGLSHTHTFAEPGVYAVLLMVLTTSCQMPAVGGPAVPPTNGLLDLQACVTVGPETAV